MDMAAAIPNKFDETILETLELCITKMSKKLRETFDPDKAESQSLFRVFCSAINTRSKVVRMNAKSVGKEYQELEIITKAKAIVDKKLASIPQKSKKRGGIPFWRNRKLS
jgi:hypothetical protein